MVLIAQLVLVSVPVLHSAAVASWSFSLKPFMPAFIHQSQNFVPRLMNGTPTLRTGHD
jgi:hypothetical protein